MILVLDNYDSFTYNLVQLLQALGETTTVVRNDQVDVAGVLASGPEAIVISPGPGIPEDAGISVELVRRLGGRVPILGVCLGHQAIGVAYGGRVVRASRVMHGKVSAIEHGGDGLFQGLPLRFAATRYHSLVVDPQGLPQELLVTATADDGVIMALRHRAHPSFGVQFHPESILTLEGPSLVRNFLALAAAWRGQSGALG
ncbi:MAG TPA: aminodeoxychorismate/anthranilate synthase component II [Candidatus Micrarchaeia archaeon]|nr:aminodeoxychorismate/anthranilate synthase component II [Candidatus Micrarchaeia archaeon]